MLIAAALHIVFSEDLSFLKNGQYLKFIHNVIMNSFASIYFHNYLRYDEMPLNNSKNSEFIDSQRPGLHISTFLRQLMFDFLYAIEYVILLYFGVKALENISDLSNWHELAKIVILALVSIVLRLCYYGLLHVWKNVIWNDKKLIKKEFDREYKEIENLDKLHKRFLKYVFVSRNTWILGKLMNLHITLLVLPKEFTESIGQRLQDIKHTLIDFKKFLCTGKCGLKSPLIFLLSFLAIVVVLVANVFMITLLLIGIILAIPVSILLFWYNLKSGFGQQDLESQWDESDSTPRVTKQETILELPPEIGSFQVAIFHCYPDKTMAYFEDTLKKDNGIISLKEMTEVTPDELETFKSFLLSLNRNLKLQVLNLDHMDLTDEKLEKLCKLIVKFKMVTLNGSQRITALGWELFGNQIKSVAGGRLKKLELKIAAKNEDSKMKLRKEILFEEFKPSMITPSALQKIALFLPYLEEVHLDDIFSDAKIFNDAKNVFNAALNFKSTGNMVEAWKHVASNIIENDTKLSVLSLSGCAITDEIMSFLAKALVKIKTVHLGLNPITNQGWQYLKEALNEPNNLTYLSLNIQNKVFTSNFSSRFLHENAMENFSQVLLMVEEVDLSGQTEIGQEGWETLIQSLKTNAHKVKLKSLKLVNCKVKSDVLSELKFVLPGLKLEHEDTDGKEMCSCC